MLLSEWLPNPTGADSKGEWVEILNDGPAPADLSGWSLQMSKGKPVALEGVIGAGEYKVFARPDFKLTLRNTDESIALINPLGRQVDESVLKGTAIEGKSLNRAPGTPFFAEPTPGRPNKKSETGLIANEYPLDTSLVPASSTFEFAGYLLGTAVTLAAICVFILKQFNATQELFFGRY